MKKALSLILVIIMLLSVVPMTALSAAGAETDLAATGDSEHAVGEIFLSKNKAYHLEMLEDGTVEVVGVRSPDLVQPFAGGKWYYPPYSIDGYTVSVFSSTALSNVNKRYNIFIPADGPRVFSAYQPEDKCTVYQAVYVDSKHLEGRNTYPLYEYHLAEDGTAVLDVIRPYGSNINVVIPETTTDGTVISGISPGAFKDLREKSNGKYGWFFDMLKGVIIEAVLREIPDDLFFGDTNTYPYNAKIPMATFNITGETKLNSNPFQGRPIALNIVGDKDIPDEFFKNGSYDGSYDDYYSDYKYYQIMEKLTVGGGVKKIGKKAFLNQKIKELKLEEGIKTIGREAFAGCEFDSIEIPKSVTSIGDYAIGYDYDAVNETYNKRTGFKISCYKGSAGEAYAIANGFKPNYLEDVGYDLWVGSTQVMGSNKNDILDDGGKAKFDPKTNTLTLNDPTITDGYDGDYCAIYSELDNLTIKGKATINHPDVTESICANNLTLSGDFNITADETPVFVPDGSLTIEDSTLKLCSASGGAALDCEYGDLTVTDSSVTTVDAGIWVRGDVKTNYSTLNVDVYLFDYGIYAGEGASFKDSSVTVTGSAKYGVFASKGAVIITGTKLDAYGSVAAVANQNSMAITNYSTVSARGGKYGVMCIGKLKISSDTSYVEAWGTESAIKGYKGLTVGEGLPITEPVGGKVNAAGTDIVNASDKTATYVKLEMPAPAAILGDVDGDGEVTIIDATAIQRRLADMPTDLYSKDAADVDSDGDVSVLDVSLIQRYLASFSVSEPIGLTIT